ncbi:uncharacterized protein EDB93DRAFT_774828 [Suillus bovinus]|uniref:uncharacterized protein n=1 Tax=Suillus bovinus TaxID=48563 RepID=UPI001B88117D|nr:uncharacterized protein EDB93DRAFT_774828 [Suillus bovinus]KAG2136566.1 hypothetical protein EDB93DRAFT_774828 [Suillus bovinus]
MNTKNQNQTIESSENWDDDFEFQQSNESNLDKHQAAQEPRLSVASSAFTEDWDTEGNQQNIKHSSPMVLGHNKNHPAFALEEWAEPGPSTPTKRSTTQAENWDDDFEDRTEFPAKRHPHAYSLKIRHSYHTPPRLKSASDPENWDDDFETDKADTPMTKRTRQEAYPDSSDDEAEFGFTDKEEDRTITACSRPQLKLRQSPPPPVPAFPLSLLSPVEPFPRSPTVSVFSIPTTSGRNSVGYTSTSHLALRPSASGGSLAMLPPSPPIHRERRRLRKKSRPPHIENNVFELIEEQRDSPPPLPPSTPERPSTSPLPQSDTGSTGPQKTPLLSRIGSVKWGVRKKRASAGPAEVMMHELGHEDQEHTPRPTSSLTSDLSSMRPSWFFRSGGAPGFGSPPPPPAELKHEKSMNSMHSAMLSTPTKLSKRKSSKMFDPSSSSEVVGTPGKPSLLSVARRPTSMQVPQGKIISTSSGTRHTSYGSSVGRMASQTFGHPSESAEDLQHREGSRGFMGSIRKISLISGTKHKRQKSTAEVTPLPPVPMSPTPLLPDEFQHPDQLLPPIELQPPSPPKTLNGVTASHSAPNNISQGVESLFVPSSSAPASLSPKASPVSASRASPGKASSPQSASLGRATQVPLSPSSSTSVPRRNSLGDLKIPARISQAQISLKRDLGMVREFAASVDKLKELQAIHHHLVAEVHTALESSHLSRAASPLMTHPTRPRSRLRSNTEPKSSFSEHKHLAAALNAITTKYKIPWECAELLIELGGGTPSPASPPPSTVSAPAAQAEIDLRKSRERAVTLSGEESKLPPGFVSSAATAQSNLSWRSSSGRHDLTQRQLVLLRDILNSTDGALPDDALVSEETHVNRQWRWGDAMSSTVTLPSEESVQTSQNGKKRRHSRIGMSGLRDMLRSLKRSYSSQPSPLPASTTSLSTQSSMGSQSQHHYPHAHLPRSHPQRTSKTSARPESRHTGDALSSPYNGQSLKYKSSPRRPSLASVFRLGQKNKNASSGAESSLDSAHGSRCASRGSATTEEEDWDRIDSVTDLDGAARALGIDGSATIKGKKGRSPYLNHPHEMRPMSPKRECSSQTSLKCEPSPRSIRPMRSTRLSNVEEVVDDRQARLKLNAQHRTSRPRTSPSRPPSRNYKLAISGSVRSAPSQPPDGDSSLFSEFKLSMTPENIKPLLDNAKEVHLRLNECIREVRALLDASTNSPSS